MALLRNKNNNGAGARLKLARHTKHARESVPVCVYVCMSVSVNYHTVYHALTS